jgi:tRNA modification GTPase
MRAPHTYTRQDIVEINAHGGIAPLREILSLCLESGARLAHEGEFTLRAFLNGRIDLAQAEAVLDIITARTESALRIAVQQLGGHLSRRTREIRARLLDLLAYLEASIDFPEDEIPPRQIDPDLRWVERELADLLRQADRGMIYRQGVRAAIVGRPNVGKSSLLNRLLRTERAIVTPIPGTTRDTLEETIALEGIPFVLVDTAGISETVDTIERLSIERSRASLQRADLALLVVDGSQSPTEADHQVGELAAARPAIVVINKSDLPSASDYATLLPTAPHIAVSALTGAGIPDLEALLVETIFSGHITLSDEPLVSNFRHRELLRRAREQVIEA